MVITLFLCYITLLSNSHLCRSTPLVKPHGNPDMIVKAKEGEAACPRCGGKVFSAEMMMAKDRVSRQRIIESK